MAEDIIEVSSDEVEKYFNAADDDTIVTEDAPLEPEVQQEDEVVTDEQPIVEDEKPDPLQSFREEFLQQMEQREQKLYGKIGELNRTIIELKQTNTGRPKAITAEQLTHFKEEFGPEVAELLAKDLSGLVLETSSTAPSVDEKKLTESLITLQHRDWRSIADSAQFAEFRNNLPPNEQHLLSTTWDAWVISDAISSFKAFNNLAKMENFEQWKSKLTNRELAEQIGKSLDPSFYTEAAQALTAWNAEQAKKKASSQAKQQEQQKRLGAAVSPRGNGSVNANLTVEDYFNKYADG